MTFLPLFSISDAFSTSGFGFILVLIVLAVIMIFVRVLSKIINGSSKKEETNEVPAETPVTLPATEAKQEPVVAESAPELPYTPGYVTLDGVAEQDAAVVMAIISDKTGTPLERLCFKSIRRLNQEPELVNIEEQDAAVAMAIVSHNTGISLDNLIFNSIKLVEE